MKKKDFILLGVIALFIAVLLVAGNKLRGAHPANPVLDTGNVKLEFVTP